MSLQASGCIYLKIFNFNTYSKNSIPDVMANYFHKSTILLLTNLTPCLTLILSIL